jgi:hypothetical protein
MSKEIPKFHNEAAERAFWDTHDATEYLDQFEDDAETLFIRPEMGVVELRPALWRQLLRVAKQRRTTPGRLVENWLKEKLTSVG